MAINILMPALSPTMQHGNIKAWVKNEGDYVKPGDVILEIETDKAIMEFESSDEGILGKIFMPSGAVEVPVNHIIGVLIDEGEEIPEVSVHSQSTVAVHAEPQKPINNVRSSDVVKPSVDGDRVKASPLAKKIAINNNISIQDVPYSGVRIVKQDVLNFMDTQQSVIAPQNTSDDYELVPHSAMRKVIAERLTFSKTNVPHFYLEMECCIDAMLSLRGQLNAIASSEYRISVNDMIIKAVARALERVPEINVSWAVDGMKKYKSVDISVAVAIDGGLITPVLRSAHTKSVGAISSEMRSLISKAKAGKLQLHEFSGGTFSISNLGMYGISRFQAILNPPQAAILAVGGSVSKVCCESDGTFASKNIINFNLSLDHRAVDGAIGAMFLKALVEIIESPLLLLV